MCELWWWLSRLGLAELVYYREDGECTIQLWWSGEQRQRHDSCIGHDAQVL